ncbi:MAG: hypothetical protein HOE14_05540 [Gemmatimonadales bacterium]|jgi:hypothetical protein|nr:hypothetical protein [Gemmatimonadales bacterium]
MTERDRARLTLETFFGVYPEGDTTYDDAVTSAGESYSSRDYIRIFNRLIEIADGPDPHPGVCQACFGDDDGAYCICQNG